jgi:hypothetical protein
MRRFVMILAASASAFASTVDPSVTCDGVTDGGGSSVSCETTNANASAEASLAGQFVDVWAWSNTGGTSSASASLSMSFIFTVFGGSGNGSADPQMYVSGDAEGSEIYSWASASMGCDTWVTGSGQPISTCTPTSVPFVFGIPQTLTLSLDAGATSGPGYPGGVSGSAGFGGLALFIDGEPAGGATYTLTPVAAPIPEPGMFPLLAMMACATLAARQHRMGR